MREVLFALASWILIVSGLSGCATLREKAVSAPSMEAQQSLYRLSAWKLEGRIAAKAGNEGWNVNLLWEHEGEQERVRLFGPFNQGAVSINVQNDLFYIDEGNGVASTSRDPDELLKNRLGFTVPLKSLRYWVLGLPAPNIEYKPGLDASGGLQGFEQQGWLLRIESFATVGNLVLPRKMSIRGNEVTLKLIADEWVFSQ